MKNQKTLFIKADIGDEVEFKHTARKGRVMGVVDNIIYSRKDRSYTYHIMTRTKAGNPYLLHVPKANIIQVLARRKNKDGQETN